MRSRYHSRHLAQEGHLKETKTEEELEHTKSTIRCVASMNDKYEYYLEAPATAA